MSVDRNVPAKEHLSLILACNTLRVMVDRTGFYAVCPAGLLSIPDCGGSAFMGNRASDRLRTNAAAVGGMPLFVHQTGSLEIAKRVAKRRRTAMP